MVSTVIGSYVADFLLARSDDVVVVDEVNDYYDVAIKEANLELLMSKYGSDKLKIYRGDICDEALMTNIFETEQPKWVCHMDQWMRYGPCNSTASL